MVRILLLTVLTLATGGLYLNSFPGTFHYDDYPLLLENPLITSGAFPLSAFWSHYWGRPLTLWTFWVDYTLFSSDPFFFHLANCLLHLCVVGLLFFVVRRYIGGDGLAFSTALIFAVHPVQSQAVNYVWSRSVLLMALFVLLALLVWRRFPLLGLIIAQLAIWSRAEAVVLGLLLILLMPRWWKWVSVLIGANLAVLAGALWRDSGAGVGWNHSDPLSYWVASPAVLWKYLWLMVWPARQTIDHPLVTPTLPLALAAFAGIAGLLFLLARNRVRCPHVVVAVGWILLFLSPSLLIPNPDQVNESRSYLAFAGFALLIALVLGIIGVWTESVVKRRLLFARWLRQLGLSRSHVVSGVLLVLLAGGFGSMTLLRNRLWQDEVGIWREAAIISPASVRCRYNLGVALIRAGKLQSAQAAFERALELGPFDDMSCAALGYCAEIRGDFAGAMGLYRRSLGLNAGNTYAAARLKDLREVLSPRHGPMEGT